MSGSNFNITTTLAGSGSSGGVNYGSSTVTDYTAYEDAAGTTPVDMTGGSPSITLTSTTSTPLRGASSMLLTHGAADCQGEGFADTITIDDADKCKVLTITFDYEIASGTYATGDLAVYVYDVTNSTLIQPSGYQIQNTGIESKHIATFQTTTSTSYRWGFHCATSTATAYTMKIDNVVVGPQVVQYGAPVTDWTSFTPTGSWSSNTTYAGQWRRVGSEMEIRGKVSVTGAPTSASLTVNLPSGYTIDTTKLNYDDSTFTTVGHVLIRDSGTATFVGIARSASATPTLVGIAVGDDGAGGVTTSAVTQAVPMTWASGDALTFECKVPIVGWSSAVQMSNDTDTRVVTAQVSGDAASASSGNPIIFPTANWDTHGGYNATTGRYTVSVPGYYKMYGALFSANAGIGLNIYKNEVSQQFIAVTDAGGDCAFAGAVSCVAGDVIDIRPGGTLDISGGCLNIERLSGPSAIAASETVTARYTTNTANNVVTGTIIDFEDKEYDSHNAVTVGASWKFTAPVSGTYRLNARIATGAGTSSAISDVIGMRLSKNSAAASTYVGYTYAHTTSSNNKAAAGTIELKLLASETVSLLGVNSTGQTHALLTVADLNYIEITRVGNY